ncbi:MAG: AarF/ABC1/UbiB kinase family protein [Clostridia bacterium]|nr:AarF/ABC1/UbiB kinase family protein [Clostridia bacterium]
MKKEKEIKTKSKKSRSRVWHIVRVLTKYNAVLKLNPNKLRLMLEELGPTYVKLGQLMSMRPDILPLEYCQALEGLRTSVKPMPFDNVRHILEREWGEKIESVCEYIEEEPIGSASIAEVYKAKLRTGENVVIKVQREHIYEIMHKDIKLLRRASKLLKLSNKVGSLLDYEGLIDEMWKVAKEELDFLHEAENMRRLQKNNEGINYVKVPNVYEEYTTDKVLVMECINGVAIDDIDALKENEYELTEIASKLSENYVKQVIEDGFYHADPHPGNIRIEDGKIVWLDMGMMGVLSERDRVLFKNAILAVIENDASALKDICLILGNVYGEIDHIQFNQDINIFLSKYGDLDLDNMQISEIFKDFSDVANRNNIAIPKSLTMFVRGLLSIESVISKLDNTISIMQVMKTYFSNNGLARSNFENIKKSIDQKTFITSKKMLEVPALLSDYLKSWSKGQSKLNCDVNVNSKSVTSANKIVNRIALSLIMCVLILGGAVCTLSNNVTYLFGLPVVSWVMFWIAFCIGVVLIVPVIVKFFKRFK